MLPGACEFPNSFFFFFLGLYQRHMEVPRLGVKVEIQLLAYITATAMQDLSRVCNLHHSTQQHQILNPLIKGRNWTHVLMDTSQVRYCWATTGTSAFIFWVMDINSFCCTSKDVHCEEAEERGLNSLHMNQPEEHPSWIVMMDESWGSAQLGRVLVKTVLSSGAWRWATVKSQKNSTQHWVQRTIKSTGYEG